MGRSIEYVAVRAGVRAVLLVAFAAITVAAEAPTSEAPQSSILVPWECVATAAARAAGLSPALPNPACADVGPRVTFGDARRIRVRSLPSTPGGLTASVSGSTVVLTWSAPTGGGDAPTSYIVEAGSASGRTDLASMDTASTVPALTATGVGAGTYYVRIRSRNQSGTSAPSNEVVVTVGSACSSVPPAPSQLAATVSGSNVTLTWQAPPGACGIGSYSIEAGSSSGSSNLASFSTGNSNTLFSATGVPPGTYFVRVRAVNTSGVSAPSNEATFTVGATGCLTPPGAPTGLAATVSGVSVTLTWNAPSGLVTSYTLEAGSGVGQSNVITSDLGNVTSLVASASPGVYYVRIRARNNCGVGPASNEVVLTIASSGPGTTLNGTVVDARTLNVVAGARITVTGGVGTGQATVSDFNGKFQLTGLAGPVTFVAQATGYAEFTKTVDASTSVTAQYPIQQAIGPTYACGDGPNIGNRVIPLFSSPFRVPYVRPGYFLWNYFDHELPMEFVSYNGTALNSCGQKATDSYDSHQGVDYPLSTGTPLYSAADGLVVYAQATPPFVCPALGNQLVSALLVYVRHPAVNGEQFQSIYNHLSRIDVKVGQNVTRGQQIGLSGSSGCSTGPHLHFEVTRLTHVNNGSSAVVDPYGWEGTGADPWSIHPQGGGSFWLWRPGEAPPYVCWDAVNKHPQGCRP